VKLSTDFARYILVASNLQKEKEMLGSAMLALGMKVKQAKSAKLLFLQILLSITISMESSQ